MLVIGLTGNIACGKSTVSRMLADLGAQTIDADKLVHALQTPGSEVYVRIVARHGRHVLRSDGAIDRAALGRIVFADRAEMDWLERLTHPAVVAETARLLSQANAPVVVIEAVKLVEAGMQRLCDQLWIVVCDADVQLARLIARGTDAEAARRRIAAQPDLAPKLGLATAVIDNSGSIEETREQVRAAWNRMLVQ